MSKKDLVKDEPVEEVTEEIVKDEPVEEYTGDLRGFKTLKEAKDYINTPAFAKLDKGCRSEYMSWLKSILKED